MPLSLAEFTRFFQSKKDGTYRCRVCASDQYFAHSANDVMSDIHVSSPLPNRYYGMICTNCGCTDYFVAELVDEWVAANKAE